jgi:WD40 repeat protein
MAVNTEQNRIAIACEDGSVKVFRCETDLEVLFQTDSFVSAAISVCFDNEGHILMGSNGGQIARADREGGRFLTVFNIYESENTKIWCICPVFGSAFATGDSRGHVVIWDPITATALEDFNSHQADVCCLASSDTSLYASGFDPTIISFSYFQKSKRWTQTGQTRMHTHDVVSLAIGPKSEVFSGARDACLCVHKSIIYPFQSPPPIACAIRDGCVVAVGGVCHQLCVWKMDGHAAHHEVKLKVNEEGNFVDVVAISRDGCHVAYSASGTRTLRYKSSGQWQLDSESYSASSSLCYSDEGKLYCGTIDGNVFSDSVEATIGVGFPVFRIAISTNGNDICVGGFEKIALLPGDLESVRFVLPGFGGFFSTFAFQPRRNRLFIGNGGRKVIVFNTLKQKFLPEMAVKFGKGKEAAANTVVFHPVNRDKVMIASSSVAKMMILTDKKSGCFVFPYSEILFIDFAGSDKIVVFEKPWSLMMSGLPKVFLAKRFLTGDEEQLPRY